MVFFGFQLLGALAAVCCQEVGRAVLALEGGLGLALLEGLGRGAVPQGFLLEVPVLLEDALDLRADAVFVGELEVAVNEALDRGRDQMLMHEGICELLLVIAQLILVEIELVVSGDVGRSQLLGEDLF